MQKEYGYASQQISFILMPRALEKGTEHRHPDWEWNYFLGCISCQPSALPEDSDVAIQFPATSLPQPGQVMAKIHHTMDIVKTLQLKSWISVPIITCNHPLSLYPCKANPVALGNNTWRRSLCNTLWTTHWDGNSVEQQWSSCTEKQKYCR